MCHVQMSFVFVPVTGKSQRERNSTCQEVHILMNILCLSPHLVLLDIRGQQIFPIKGQGITIVGFWGRAIFVATTQQYWNSPKAAVDVTKWVWLWFQ